MYDALQLEFAALSFPQGMTFGDPEGVEKRQRRLRFENNPFLRQIVEWAR